MNKILLFLIIFYLIISPLSFAKDKTIRTANLEFTFIIVEYTKEKGDTNRFSVNQTSLDEGEVLQNFSLILPVMLKGKDFSTMQVVLKIGDDIWTITNESIVKIGEGRLVVNTSLNVKDGQEGTVKLITKEPYNSIKTIGNKPQNVIEFIDVGVNITAKPNIINDTIVNSDIDLKISEVMRESEKERNVHIPVVSSRDIQTNIDFKIGQLELLGELTINKKINTHSGVPFLRKIPFLGPVLFSSFREQVIKTKLYIVAGVRYSDQRRMESFERLQKENIEKIEEQIKFR